LKIRSQKRGVGNLDFIKGLPPQNIEAEQSVLGAIILENEVIEDVNEILCTEDFFREDHKVIYDNILSLHKRNEIIDLISLSEEIKKQNLLDAIGGIVYLTQISTAVPTISNAKYYAKIVKEKSSQRKLLKIASGLKEKAIDGNIEVSQLIEEAVKSIQDVNIYEEKENYFSVSSSMRHSSQMFWPLRSFRLSE
jgi:replicative DNA helicase